MFIANSGERSAHCLMLLSWITLLLSSVESCVFIVSQTSVIRRMIALTPQSSRHSLAFIWKPDVQTSRIPFVMAITLSLAVFLTSVCNSPLRTCSGLTSRAHVHLDINLKNIPYIRSTQFTTEWAIPYVNTEACLRDLRKWLEQEHESSKGLRPHFPLEIRFSDADDIWLSPSFGQKTTWIGIIQYKYVIFISSLLLSHERKVGY